MNSLIVNRAIFESSGLPGPGEIKILFGLIFIISSVDISSFRLTITLHFSAPKAALSCK